MDRGACQHPPGFAGGRSPSPHRRESPVGPKTALTRGRPSKSEIGPKMPPGSWDALRTSRSFARVRGRPRPTRSRQRLGARWQSAATPPLSSAGCAWGSPGSTVQSESEVGDRNVSRGGPVWPGPPVRRCARPGPPPSPSNAYSYAWIFLENALAAPARWMVPLRRSLDPSRRPPRQRLKHRRKCGNPVRTGDGSATVSGHRPPSRKAATGHTSGKAGARSRPGARTSRRRCSSGRRPLGADRFAAKRRMRPAGSLVREPGLVDAHTPSFSVRAGGMASTCPRDVDPSFFALVSGLNPSTRRNTASSQ